MFRPTNYNALDREFRPGRPLSTEIKRRIVGLYSGGEGPREISPTVRVAYGGVFFFFCFLSFVIIKRTSHIFPLVEEDKEILLNFQTTF